ncbi:MAG: hypothetical protein WDM89_13405 [Rhizomicrobium sp.]
MTIVANEGNMTRDAAAVRIDNLQKDVQARTKKAADLARKVASYTSFVDRALATVRCAGVDDRGRHGARRRRPGFPARLRNAGTFRAVIINEVFLC